MLLFVNTTICKTFIIFTWRYFKLSWNTTALSQSNCRNFSCSSISKRNTRARRNHFSRRHAMRKGKGRYLRKVIVPFCSTRVSLFLAGLVFPCARVFSSILVLTRSLDITQTTYCLYACVAGFSSCKLSFFCFSWKISKGNLLKTSSR